MPAREAEFAAWMLGWPISVGLATVALVQLGTWLPHYLTWPYWADHDVFATAAREWDLGIKPYRDFLINGFPGETYLFYGLGKLGGWGKSPVFYAFDAGLLLAFLATLVGWSVRRFGRALPGLIGSIAFLSYYLSLDYSHAGQRDWHASCIAMIGLMLAQAWPGRGGRLASAWLAAVALSNRPQVVVFLPALLMANVEDETGEVPASRLILRGVGWLAILAAFTALAFSPLAVAGIFGDFLRSLRHVAYGSSYNRVSLASLAKDWAVQAAGARWLVVPAGILILARLVSSRDRTTARAWLLALAGVSVYKPMSPMAHSYLDLPLVLVWSIDLAVLAGLVTSAAGVAAPFRLAAVIGLLGMGTTTLHPFSCALGPSRKAFEVLRGGTEPEDIPPGYRKSSVGSSAWYGWEDYRGVLSYLRRKTKPTTKVANALKGDPAILSAIDRPSAFPAESIAWLRMVDEGDEPAFAESLRRAGEDSVVVWSPEDPGPNPMFRIELIEDEIRRLYEFEEVFGPIQVWRRKPGAKP